MTKKFSVKQEGRAAGAGGQEEQALAGARHLGAVHGA